MSNHVSDEIWLVGAGRMARAHAKVLKAIGRPFRVIGRGAHSAQTFTEEIGVEVKIGGLDDWLVRADAPAGSAIVAVNVSALAESAIALMERGVRRLLLEKPGGVEPDEIDTVVATASKTGTDVYVAYNRRFFASVREARRLVAEDGGVTSFSFEFTELADAVARSPHPDRVKQNWFIANSSHVVDLAFFLGGEPDHMRALVAGSLPWHRKAARFAGCGTTRNGALFNYGADWGSAGRWGVEVMTPARRLMLRPLEVLQVQPKGTSTIEQIKIDDRLDQDYKPGLFRQMEAFVHGRDAELLLDIHSHARRLREVFLPILDGDT